MNEIKMACKFCKELDHKENMHCDIFTGEYYHTECSIGGGVGKKTKKQEKREYARAEKA